VPRVIFSIIPHGIGVEARFSLGRDVIGWKHSKTTGTTHWEKVIVWHIARANNSIRAGTELQLNTTHPDNDSEMKKVAEERKLYRMGKVNYFLEMWQGSQNLCATQKESCTHNRQMPTVEDISHMYVIVQASWPLFEHAGVAGFKSSERSPLPPALFAKDLPDGQS
jgi:hypothetical protein